MPRSIVTYLFAVCALTAAPAFAATKLLKCNFANTSSQVELTIDEDNSRVTYFLEETGYISRMSAAFGDDAIRFADRNVQYVLSRTDLSITRFIRLLRETDRGQCRIAPAPKRIL